MMKPDDTDAMCGGGALPPGRFMLAPAVTTFTPTLERGEITARALVIDTETTGRGVMAEIIEVGVCTIDGEIIFESLVRPTSRVPSAAARIHGLTTETLVGAPTWERVWASLYPLMTGRTLIAYNAGFDRRMIDLMTEGYRLRRADVRWRCAMRFVKAHGGWRHAPSLEEACRRYGITPGTHRAAADAVATAALLRRIVAGQSLG